MTTKINLFWQQCPKSIKSRNASHVLPAIENLQRPHSTCIDHFKYYFANLVELMHLKQRSGVVITEKTLEILNRNTVGTGFGGDSRSRAYRQNSYTSNNGSGQNCQQQITNGMPNRRELRTNSETEDAKKRINEFLLKMAKRVPSFTPGQCYEITQFLKKHQIPDKHPLYMNCLAEMEDFVEESKRKSRRIGVGVAGGAAGGA